MFVLARYEKSIAHLCYFIFYSVSRISPESSGFEIRTPFSKEILRMSRSLGDFYLKNCRNNESEKLGPNEQAVLATPDVSVRRRNDK